MKKKQKVKVKKPKLSQSQRDQRAAAKLVDQELAPTVSEINRQKAQAASDAAKRQAFTTQLSQTVAGMAGAYAPVVKQTYADAGANQSSFGKGFSDAFKTQQNTAAAQTNQTLQQSGAPAAQMATGDTGAADALYGISGYEPASTFNREGAAFTSAAAKLPTTTALAGADYLRAAQAQDKKTMDDILAQLTNVKLKRPSLINDVLGQIQTNRSKSQQQAWDNTLLAKQFGLKVDTANTDAQYKKDTINTRIRGQNVTKRGQNITKRGKTGTKQDKFWTVRSSAFSDAKKYAKGATSILGIASGKKSKADSYDALWAEYKPRLASMGYSSKRIKTMIINAVNAAYGK